MLNCNVNYATKLPNSLLFKEVKTLQIVVFLTWDQEVVGSILIISLLSLYVSFLHGEKEVKTRNI